MKVVIQVFLKVGLLKIPNFGVSTAILNIIDVSRGWCKLNFGPLRGQVKSRYFPERRDARRPYCYFLNKFLGIIGTKRLGPFRIIIWICYYLLHGIRLDLDLDKSCWIHKLPKLCYKQLTFSFWHTKHSLT